MCFWSNLAICSLGELDVFANTADHSAKRNWIYFTSFSHKLFGSGFCKSLLLLRCLHRALSSLTQTETSCIQKRVAVNRPFKGLFTKGPWQRNVLPTQVCCSTDLLDILQITPTYGSLWIQGFSLCPPYRSVWPRSDIYCSLTYKPPCCSSCLPHRQQKFSLVGC